MIDILFELCFAVLEKRHLSANISCLQGKYRLCFYLTYQDKMNVIK